MNLTDLIAAVATSVRDCGGAPSKTKILKLLYLLDIESYRNTEATLTGFEWKFYKYGPWAASYDDALQAASQANKIVVSEREFDEGATFINPVERLSLSHVFPNVIQELTAKRIIETWAARPTVELLDYVYFHTAPMRDAVRNEPLDFSILKREEKLPHYTGIKSKADEKEIQRKRRELLKRLGSTNKGPIAPLDPPPKYDESYWSALEKLESDVD
jgi:Protein of unknown function (DUF4065)